METRVRLVKRRLKKNQVPNNTRLIVKHRPLTSVESKMHRYREKQLEPSCYEDESEQEQDEQLVPSKVQVNDKGLFFKKQNLQYYTNFCKLTFLIKFTILITCKLIFSLIMRN